MQLNLAIVDALSEVFRQHGINPITVDFARLIATDKVLTERFDGDTSLSQQVFDLCFPRAPAGEIYYHYTTVAALKEIVSMREFNLYPLSTRLSEDEFRSFCSDYGLDGFIARDANDPPFYYQLCEDLFYASLSERDSRHLWNVFANQGRGVRIGLRISPVAERSNFRRIRYEDMRTRILVGDLDCALKPFGLTFVPRGLSRYAAFYLPSDYSVEEEVRLLVKRVTIDGFERTSPWDRVRRDANGTEYLPISLDGADTFCTMRLEEVVIGDASKAPEIRDILQAQPEYVSRAKLMHRSDLNTI